VAALTGPMDFLDRNLEILRGRRDRAVEGLRDAGLGATPPRGAIYLFVRVPDGETSSGFATRMLDDAGVFVTPGSGYGPGGEGFVRLSLTIEDARLDEGIARIRKAC
jgi:LL-diaminopimelate aminotransferase